MKVEFPEYFPTKTIANQESRHIAETPAIAPQIVLLRSSFSTNLLPAPLNALQICLHYLVSVMATISKTLSPTTSGTGGTLNAFPDTLEFPPRGYVTNCIFPFQGFRAANAFQQ